MARYIQDVVLNQPEDFVSYLINDYLKKNSFTLKTWKDAPAYVRGSVASVLLIEKYRIFTWSYTNGVLHLEACLGGLLEGEMSLSGIRHWMSRVSYRNELKRLIQLLQQPLPNTAPVGDGSTDMASAETSDNSCPQVPFKVQTMDNTKAALIALVLGTTSICVYWYKIPFLSIITGMFTIFFYRSGKGSSHSHWATGGLICAIVGMSHALLMTILIFMIEYFFNHFNELFGWFTDFFNWFFG